MSGCPSYSLGLFVVLVCTLSGMARAKCKGRAWNIATYKPQTRLEVSRASRLPASYFPACFLPTWPCHCT